MKWTISHNTVDKILVIKTEGVIDLNSANEMRNAGVEQIREHGYLRCLLDHSEAQGYTLSTLDIYSLPKKYIELGIPHNFRMALVVPEDLKEDMNFFETVCRNNGYFASVFFDMDSAMAWLKS
jgi:hypothetical protein